MVLNQSKLIFVCVDIYESIFVNDDIKSDSKTGLTLYQAALPSIELSWKHRHVESVKDVSARGPLQCFLV